jgi:hypothetical protein
MKKERLTWEQLEQITTVCRGYINILALTETHLNKCMMIIFMELSNRVEKRIIGQVNTNGYLFKLKPYEKQAILYMRNEIGVRCARLFDRDYGANAIVRLLKQNI